ncbi:hypothetical protein JNB62_05495 [Microbacterium jejuense]|uniref:Uncharacterized protein n=1 Tax=Microbacterium jejuense TaxID=1263637 RepID=A0ABS7HL23_9MICO|nr:hypothetical protein [Microbacterium jejuense]MBW9093130.1 hypothetical protein [Microbacterium jejuense]
MSRTLAGTHLSAAEVLSPSEQDEATRFGIHDPEAFEQIREHYDESVPCLADGCTNPATLRSVKTCCGKDETLCLYHLEVGRAIIERNLVLCVAMGHFPSCTECGHVFPLTVTFEDAYRVVEL